MLDERSTPALTIRLATSADLAHIERLDSFSTSPTRDIHRDMEKYFGSVDPSVHERTLIFLAEVEQAPIGKAELMLPPLATSPTIGYVKRVVVQPNYRSKGVARKLMQHIIDYAQTEQRLDALDLHVWEQNHAAIRLYEALGFELQHREVYYRLSISTHQSH